MAKTEAIERAKTRKVQVASLPPADSGRGFARLPDTLMEELGLSEGDVIEIVDIKLIFEAGNRRRRVLAAGLDGVGKIIIFANQKTVSAEKNVHASCQKNQNSNAKDGTEHSGDEKLGANGPVAKPAVSDQDDDDGNPDKKRILFREDKQSQGKGIAGQPTPMTR